jgi:hypothetical protein
MRLLLLVVLVASLGTTGCGGCNEDGLRNLPDARPADAAEIDAPIDGPDRPVTLTVIKNRTPVVGVRVYFLNADSSLVKATDTDDYGQASAIMVAGGSVTAIDPFPRDPDPGVREVIVGDNDLATFAGVKPGDELVLSRNEPRRISLRLLIPDDPEASSYEVSTTCGSGTISTGGELRLAAVGEISLQDCPAAADFVVVAIDGKTSLPRAALQRADVAVSDGATIDLSASPFQPLSNVTFKFTSAPEVGGLAFQHFPVSPRGAFGVPFGGFVSLEGGAGMLTIQEPMGALGGIITANLFTGSRQHVVDRVGPASTYTTDLAGLLPTINFASYDATYQRLVWDEDATGATPDLTIGAIDVSATSERTWRWVIAAPYRRGELTFPTLPDEIARWAPSPGDSVSVERQINVKVTGGYDAIRNRVLDLREVFNSTGNPIGFVGATGRAILAQPDSVEVRRSR